MFRTSKLRNSHRYGFYFLDFDDKLDMTVSLPLYGRMDHGKFSNMPYFPVIESPGVIYIQNDMETRSRVAYAIMDVVFEGWPIIVVTLIMAALSGIAIWALVSTKHYYKSQLTEDIPLGYGLSRTQLYL